jgi:tetratricopeptide (TPR) repeat protein
MRFIFFWLFWGLLQGFAQIKSDSLSVELSRTVVEKMYNWEFAQADSTLALLEKIQPQHPGISFAKGMILYWKHYPTGDKTAELKQQFDYFEEASSLADKQLKTKPEDAELKYIKLAARSMIMKYQAEFGHYLSALSEARNLYQSTLEGMKLQNEFPDFYLTSGIYFYYREFYPETFPSYRPFMSFFKKGNRELGLKLVSKATKIGIFSQPEALAFEAHIRLRFEKDKTKGLELYQQLADRFPKNLFFVISFGEAAMLNQNYPALLEICNLLADQELKPLYKGYLHIFRAYLAESGSDWKKAENEFAIALELLPQMGKPFYQHDTFIYAGLSRAYQQLGENDKSAYFAKKARNSDVLGVIQAYSLLQKNE